MFHIYFYPFHGTDLLESKLHKEVKYNLFSNFKTAINLRFITIIRRKWLVDCLTISTIAFRENIFAFLHSFIFDINDKADNLYYIIICHTLKIKSKVFYNTNLELTTLFVQKQTYIKYLHPRKAYDIICCLSVNIQEHFLSNLIYDNITIYEVQNPAQIFILLVYTCCLTR